MEKNFVPLIDLVDYQEKSENDKQNAGLTRALAAFALCNAADLTPEIAVSSITDGYDDNGLDAVYHAAEDKTLYLCQSKWSNDGLGSIDVGGAEKFARGVRDILSLKLDRFNSKITTRKDVIEEAINNSVRINLIIVYSGSDKISEHVKRVFSDLLADLNDTGDVAVLDVVSQENLYSIVSMGGRGEPVDIAIQLFDWGQTKAPYQAFYGQVAASDVAQWGARWRHKIFSKNIRSFLGSNTAVNEGIADSIRKTPAHFWYLNNGITALCSRVQKRAVGGNSREAGTFECQGVAIVNGAQTVGTITSLAETAGEELATARVPIRLISLEGCPPEFANEVTRATNTQNRVDARNFVALDQEQARLRSELLIDGIDYEYRQGEGEPNGENRFGLVDATIALACSSSSPDLAVQAKREISKLWDDLSRPPYKLMFNSGLSGLKLWHLVQILREIDSALEDLRYFVSDARVKSVIINGNRLVAHIVFRNFICANIGLVYFKILDHTDTLHVLTQQVVIKIAEVIVDCYGDSYLAHLFKNLSKCKDVANQVGAIAPDAKAVDAMRIARQELS
ncbi:AIPR family protein [Roseicella aerolata]|uniref:AIPR family protein n=1 Tax=Roseicella aerolata TaxID=2883479 RepID=A0A9X1LAY3_9PROT|nr:AIPR family protein [Roseicella aerolata]MCB4825279.1 AIPR family protein [Roseicella aerolata]